MSKRLLVNRHPCASCPYRLDTPPGVWDASEYAKLPRYDANESAAVFLCHQTPAIGADTVCRGWLSVHSESWAARIAVARGQVTPEELYAEPEVPLYGNGQEAAEAGLAGVELPGQRARAMIERLTRKGIGR